MARRSKETKTDDFEPGLIEFIEIEHDEDPEEADTRWLIEHYSELVREYPMSWVAIADQQVVGHGSTPNRAMNDAIEALAGRGRADAAQDDEYHDETKREAKKNAPHLYFLERSADWIREH